MLLIFLAFFYTKALYLYKEDLIMEIRTDLFLGDSKKMLKKLPDSSVDLIMTSPPYADQRKGTYGGIHPGKYVEWFLPIAKELLRVLKPTGTFILNIKEKVVEGERSTYVMELIIEMPKQGWLWTEDLFGIKRIAIPANGLTAFEMHGKDFSNSIRIRNSTCTKMK
jgi:DNA modification methylase